MQAVRSCGILGRHYLADRIRESAGMAKEKDTRTQLTKRLGTIKEEKAKRARLREELEKVKALLQKADSINAALQLENSQLKAQNRKIPGRFEPTKRWCSQNMIVKSHLASCRSHGPLPTAKSNNPASFAP